MALGDLELAFCKTEVCYIFVVAFVNQLLFDKFHKNKTNVAAIPTPISTKCLLSLVI